MLLTPTGHEALFLEVIIGSRVLLESNSSRSRTDSAEPVEVPRCCRFRTAPALPTIVGETPMS
jgi:hypothetical protein